LNTYYLYTKRFWIMNQNNNYQRMNLDDFLWRALLWGLLGGAIGLQGSELGLCTILGPIGEKAFGFTLEEIFKEMSVAMERERQEKQRLETLKRIQAALEPIKLQPLVLTQASNALLPPQSQQATPRPQSLGADKENSKWRDVVRHPSIVLILGRRGSGKSGLGYSLLELFRYKLTPYVLGLPAQAEKLLPMWIGTAQGLDDIPHNSIALIDEAYLAYHARESQQAQSKEMSRIVNLSRQRAQTLIFITQEARQVDKNIASAADMVIFKEPAMLQPKFDRPELNDIAIQAKQAFASISGDRKKLAFVYSPEADFVGLMENSLPTFWSPALSRAFAAGKLGSSNRTAPKLTKEVKIARARELHDRGLSYRQIGNILGVREGTAYNYVNDYPYKI
jgi:hypothetical protein